MLVSEYQPVNLEGLLKLFTFDNKVALERYASKELVIHGSDLTALIIAAREGQFPLRYANRFIRKEPAHLHPTPEDLRALSTNGVGKFTPEAQKTVNKMFAMFDERKLQAGHLFYTTHEGKFWEWHLLSFDQRDEEARPSRNHWVEGPHVHFVNWLWPNLDPHVIWDGFVREGKRPKGVHIRFDSGANDALKSAPTTRRPPQASR